jgi:hypothetical protein
MLLPAGRAVIGLTLRYDREDNFWFCLLHELAHLAHHISPERQLIVDEMEFGTQKDSDRADGVPGQHIASFSNLMLCIDSFLCCFAFHHFCKRLDPGV